MKTSKLFIIRALPALLLVLLLFVLSVPRPSSAQAKFRTHISSQVGNTVRVDAGSPLGTLPSQAFGINTAVWDSHKTDPAIPGLLSAAGINMMRFPGGSTADTYHWTPSDTDTIMNVVHNSGAQAIFTANYGSGTPAEAAGWVNYTNNIKHYGVKYWEIGNENYGPWENGDHSPTDYGNAFLRFASAMKAEDPSIKIGAVLACGNDYWNWNVPVLKIIAHKVDFVICHWYPQEPGNESDSGLLASTSQIAGIVSSVRGLLNQYAGSDTSRIQILTTETNSVTFHPGKQTVSIVNALFAADDVMTWLEQGTTSVDWWAMHNGSMYNNNNSLGLYGSSSYGDYGFLSYGTTNEPAVNTPFPSYYGIQMLTHLGKPGDQMVSSSSNTGLVTTHAVKLANGDLAILLINKSPSTSYNMNVLVSGYAPSNQASVYFYGQQSTTISSGSRTGVSNNFIQTIPPYSLTTLVMKPQVVSNCPPCKSRLPAGNRYGSFIHFGAIRIVCC